MAVFKIFSCSTFLSSTGPKAMLSCLRDFAAVIARAAAAVPLLRLNTQVIQCVCAGFYLNSKACVRSGARNGQQLRGEIALHKTKLLKLINI